MVKQHSIQIVLDDKGMMSVSFRGNCPPAVITFACQKIIHHLMSGGSVNEGSSLRNLDKAFQESMRKL